MTLSKVVVVVSGLLMASGVIGSAMAATDEEIAAVTGAILNADGPKALQLVSSLQDTQLDDKDRRFRACMLQRLSSTPAEAEQVVAPTTGRPDGVAAASLKIYRTYWKRAVMNPGARDQAAIDLQSDIAALLHVPASTPMDHIEELLAARLDQLGIHSIEGRTGFLRELMLWSKQETKTYSVQLPEGANATNVIFMDGFYSQGWSNYLTCDRSGTGGWTKPDGLYVVAPAYKDFTGENFRVNFLAHESQHYLDHRDFPQLLPWELEYRAKLVELAYANDTMKRTLLRFESDQGDDTGSPHSYADKRVLSNLRQRLGLGTGADLGGVPTATLNTAAIEQLHADSAARRASRSRTSE